MGYTSGFYFSSTFVILGFEPHPRHQSFRSCKLIHVHAYFSDYRGSALFLHTLYWLKIPHLLRIPFFTQGVHLLLRLFLVSLLHLNFFNIQAYYVDVGLINHSFKGSYQYFFTMSVDNSILQLPYQYFGIGLSLRN